MKNEVNVASRPAALVMGVALALGILGEYLFSPGLLGVNVLIWSAALCAAALACARFAGIDLRGEGRWLLAPALLFAGFVAWRASPVLQALNVGAVILILALGSFRLRDGRVRLGGVTEYAIAGVVSLSLVAVDAAQLIATKVQWRAIVGDSSRGRFLPWVRAAAIGLPVVALFALLLSSADEVFSDTLLGAFRLDASVLVHAARSLMWAWVAAGFLHASLFGSNGPVPVAQPPAALRLGPVEVSTVLGALDALFLLFVAIQVRYLFGVGGHVEVTDGLTYAEYARRGFFELLAVAALVLPVILGVHWLLRDSSPMVRIAFRVFSATMVLLIFAVITSALRRMDAYVDEFGLTQLRLYSTVAMLWLVAVFAWLAATVLREQRRRFASGAIAAALFGLAALNVLNPDAFIVETNLDNGRKFDVAYASQLSPDATPTLVAALAKLPPGERCRLADELAGKAPEDAGWQTWNLGRSNAKDALHEVSIEEACPPG